MKNKTILLGMALAIFAMFLSSCQKETITPTEIDSNSLSIDTDIVTLTDESLELGNVLSSISFPIVVTSNPCSTGGYSLTVTSPDVDLTNGNFTINWYKNTEQTIHFVGQTLECVCGYGVRIEVLDEVGNLSAEDSLDIPGC